jgi:hypothetical protein
MQTKESVGLSFQHRFSIFYIENYELRQGSDLPAVITAWEPPPPPLPSPKPPPPPPTASPPPPPPLLFAISVPTG